MSASSSMSLSFSSRSCADRTVSSCILPSPSNYLHHGSAPRVIWRLRLRLSSLHLSVSERSRGRYHADQCPQAAPLSLAPSWPVRSRAAQPREHALTHDPCDHRSPVKGQNRKGISANRMKLRMRVPRTISSCRRLLPSPSCRLLL